VRAFRELFRKEKDLKPFVDIGIGAKVRRQHIVNTEVSASFAADNGTMKVSSE
jgi:hypothetical protein